MRRGFSQPELKFAKDSARPLAFCQEWIHEDRTRVSKTCFR